MSYHLAVEGFRREYPNETRGKSNIEIAKGGFIWIDDGKNNVKGFSVESGDKKVSVDFGDE